MASRHITSIATATIVFAGGCALAAGYDFGKYAEETGAGGAGSTASGSPSVASASSTMGMDASSSGPTSATSASSTSSTSSASAASTTTSSSSTGGGMPIVLTGTELGPTEIALDATNVYWIDEGNFGSPNASVNRIAKTGGSVVAIAQNINSPLSLGLDATYAYFFTSDTGVTSLNRVLKVGGMVDNLLPNIDACDLAVYAGNIYLSTPTSIARVDIDGQNMTTLVAAGAPCGAIAVDATGIYWADVEHYMMGAGMIMHAGLDGSSPTPIASGYTWPRGLGLDATNVYWLSDDNAGNGFLWMVDKLGKTQATQLDHGLGSPSQVVSDGTSLFWTEDDEVRTMTLAAKTPSVLADTGMDDPPHGIGVDGTSAFYTTEGGMGMPTGTISKVAK